MVLFTLLGLSALFLRDRKNGNNSHSGQDENVDQSDDGQTSRDFSSDPVVLPTTEEPITGDSQVDDDWSQDQSLEVPIIDDPQDDDDWSEFQLLEEPIIDDPQDGDDWSEFQLLEEPIIDDPQDGDDWSEFPLLEESIIDDSQDGDDWSEFQLLEEPIIDDPQDGDDWSEFPLLEEPIIDDPQDGDDWSEFPLLEEPIIDDSQDGDDWSEFPLLEEPIIDDSQDGDDWSEFPLLEEPIIDDSQDGDDWSEFPLLEEPIIDDSQDGDDWSEFPLSEESIIDDPQDGDDSSDDVSYSPSEDSARLSLNQQQAITGTFIEINSKSYELGNQLGKGGFGAVFEATRLEDGVQVAVKIANNDVRNCSCADAYFLPIEIALHIVANEPRVPQIIQLLDWQEQGDRVIMVLERPMPCQSLDQFFRSYRGPMDEEDLARIVMRQVALAAQICCQRGVFHRDIKPQNLLINPETLEVKLIDFGCGVFLNSAGYTSFAGTKKYRPLEYIIDGRYHGEPATVWSLGLVLFEMLCSSFPRSSDLDLIQDDIWTKDGLSEECCDFIRSCLRLDPKKRIKLEDVLLHDWFKINEVENNNERILEINSKSYEIGNQLGEKDFGVVFEATCLEDGVPVALKFISKAHSKHVRVDGYFQPLPIEIALHIVANEPRVCQIIQLLDWQDRDDHYIMVLERPMPCQSLDQFFRSYRGPMDEEDLAKLVMWQVALAAQICCQRGVFHRDIKPQNLLIDLDSLIVKLIDFGSGVFLNSAGYTSYAGTKKYCPLEYIIDGRYHGEPATVWSLGIVLFEMLCSNCPRSSDLDKIFKENIVSKDGLSEECCDFIRSCLRLDPKKRIKLEDVLLHDWFKSGTMARLTLSEEEQ